MGRLEVIAELEGGNLMSPPALVTFNPLHLTSDLTTSPDGWNVTEKDGVNGTMMTDMEEIQFSLTFQVCIYIMYNVAFVGAVAGNLLVVYVVGWSRRMRTVTNFLIGNLAVGDLLMALLCVPFSYIPVLLQYWPFGRLLCHLVSPAQAVCVFVSAYTLVALAIDRYMAILYPLRPRLRRSQALVVIAVVWVVALVTAAPIAMFTQLTEDPISGRPLCEESGWEDEQMKLAYSLTLMILQYFFPISVLIFTYTRIALAVWGKKAPGEAEDARDQRLAKAKRKTVVMTLCVVVGYTLAWLPLNLFQLYLETFAFDPQGQPLLPHVEYVFFLCHFLAMAHTTYNPIIYAWINCKFRAAFLAVFERCVPTSLKKKKPGGGGAAGFSRGLSSRSRTLRTTATGYHHNSNARLNSLNNNGAVILLKNPGGSGGGGGEMKGQLL